jgi:hypothetical protein
MSAAAFWICCWAYINCTGWALAALHQLNPAGYAIALLPGAVWGLSWLKKHPPILFWPKYFRRFRRPLPAVFLLLAGLIFLGGALYAPTNYDALTYRLPRMLNWLAAGKWFWIPTINERLNYSAVAWEWMAMPLLALMRSDRALFLIDFSGFLLMPGLLFSIFRQLGAGRRVAWTWMWILPLAYGYATQAGSIGNDLTGTVFCLLSVFFGLRARRSGRLADVWLALLAAALMTGVKVSNAPLALPCLVAVWPALGQLRKHLVSSFFLASVAMVVSAAPIMALNQIHAGSWTGDPNDQYHMQVRNPAAGLLGNGLLLAEQALMPPVLPNPRAVHNLITRHLPGSWTGLLKRDFPRYSQAGLGELPSEEGSGIGLGITVLLLAGVAASCRNFRCRLPLVAAAGWIAGLFYLLKMGSEAGPRLMLPYYPLMILPFLLLPGQKWLVQSRAGRILAMLVALSILPVLVLSATRPLWPGRVVCEKLAAKYPTRPVFQRMASVYATYANRNDLLAPVRARLPDDAREIGFIAGSNDTDYSLWRPFGRRKIIYLRQNAARFLNHPDEIQWLVVKENEWQNVSSEPLAGWAQTNHFQIVASVEIVELVAWGGERWCLLHNEK